MGAGCVKLGVFAIHYSGNPALSKPSRAGLNDACVALQAANMAALRYVL